MESRDWKRKPVFILLNVITVLACIFLAFVIGEKIVEYDEMTTIRKPSEDTYSWYYKNERYMDMANYYLEGTDTFRSGKTKEYCAVGAYYVEKMMVQSFLEEGDEKGAAFHKTLMEEAAAAMGDLSISKDRIDKVLDMTNKGETGKK